MTSTSVGTVAEQIRQLMRSQELLPGQPMRQEALAERLGVSRVPVREALKALAAEGVVRHQPNAGYTVTRLSADELRQAYLMRAALEDTVLRELPRPGATMLLELSTLHDRLATATEASDVPLVSELDHNFHFVIFRSSGLHLIVDEIERIWQMTEIYRSVCLYDEAARRRIVRENQQLINVLQRGQQERAVEIMHAQREATQAHLAPSLALAISHPG